MSNATNLIIEPLQLDFFLRALLAATLVMVGGAALGFGVITKKTAYFGQGVSLGMLAGVALGALLSIPLALSALLSALITTALISTLTRFTKISSDASIAIISSALFSIGVVIISSNRDNKVNLTNILFGNVLGVTWSELTILATIALLASTITLTQGRKLALAAISPTVASAHGVSLRKIEMLRQVSLALLTASSIQVVGVTLSVAALVLPYATASILSKNLAITYLLATLIATITATTGLYLSYYLDTPSGPTVVILSTFIYLLAFTLTKSLNYGK